MSQLRFHCDVTAAMSPEPQSHPCTLPINLLSSSPTSPEPFGWYLSFLTPTKTPVKNNFRREAPGLKVQIHHRGEVVAQGYKAAHTAQRAEMDAGTLLTFSSLLSLGLRIIKWCLLYLGLPCHHQI